jgi:hypothetical protein
MGLRHIVVVDSDHLVVGMITRKDITAHRLDLHWSREVSVNCLTTDIRVYLINLFMLINRVIIFRNS